MQDLAALSQRRPHMAADIRQFGAGGVRHRVLVGNAAADLVLQKAVAVNGQEDLVDGCRLHGIHIEIFLGTASGVKEIPYTDQL